MKKSFLVLSSLAIVVLLGVGLSSCKDDEKPSKAKVSFASASKTVQESAGTIEVKVTLDRALSKDVIVTYDLAGTALEKAGINQGDYQVNGDAGEITIAKGETIGVIKLDIINDLNFEVDETIDITLSDVNSTDAEISTDDETVVTIQSDDPKPIASFTNPTLTVNEDDGIVEIQVQLDKIAAEDIIVEYTLSAGDFDAIDSVRAHTEQSDADYAIVKDTPGQLTIKSGQMYGKIKIRFYSDFAWEDDEPFTISLKETSTIALADNSELNGTLVQQDGKVIVLSWNDQTADMDLVLWAGADLNSLNTAYAVSAIDNALNDFYAELVFVPSVITSGNFGLTLNYYSGTNNALSFKVEYIDFIDGVTEGAADRDAFTATYTLANVKAWEKLSDLTQREQTFKIAASQFTEISGIVVPVSGSRSSSIEIPAGMDKVRPKMAKPTFSRSLN
jgi:hypothetical protein